MGFSVETAVEHVQIFLDDFALLVAQLEEIVDGVVDCGFKFLDPRFGDSFVIGGIHRRIACDSQ